ncbi:MAG: hypothetical protein NTW16_00950 [Bacteroidetes bacterium]|nr:hypothetical protein [Bacteroidota bacterium]
MTRVKESMAAQDRMNKASGVTAEHLKWVNDLFENPVISAPISFKISDDKKMEPKQTGQEEDIQETGNHLTR